MGYWTKPSRITENEAMLTALLNDIIEGRQHAIPVPPGLSTSKARHSIREILASCREFPEVLDGRFANLADAVTLSVDYKLSRIIASPSKAFLRGETVLTRQDVESTPIDTDIMEELKQAAERAKPSLDKIVKRFSE